MAPHRQDAGLLNDDDDSWMGEDDRSLGKAYPKKPAAARPPARPKPSKAWLPWEKKDREKRAKAEYAAKQAAYKQQRIADSNARMAKLKEQQAAKAAAQAEKQRLAREQAAKMKAERAEKLAKYKEQQAEGLRKRREFQQQQAEKQRQKAEADAAQASPSEAAGGGGGAAPSAQEPIPDTGSGYAPAQPVPSSCFFRHGWTSIRPPQYDQQAQQPQYEQQAPPEEEYEETPAEPYPEDEQQTEEEYVEEEPPVEEEGEGSMDGLLGATQSRDWARRVRGMRRRNRGPRIPSMGGLI